MRTFFTCNGSKLSLVTNLVFTTPKKGVLLTLSSKLACTITKSHVLVCLAKKRPMLECGHTMTPHLMYALADVCGIMA